MRRNANVTASISLQEATRGNFVNALEKSLRRRCGYEGEIVIQSFFIHLRRYCWMLQQRLDLRSEHETAVVMMVVERLHVRAIAHEHKPLALRVPQGNRK